MVSKGSMTVLLALATATPATAAEVVFNLNQASGGLTGSAGNWITRTSTTVDGESVQARFSAFSAKKNSDGTFTISEAYLGRFSNGLGVTAKGSSGDGDGGNNLHAIDNKDTYDFILVQFDQAVVLESAKLTPFKVGQSTDNDSTIGIRNTFVDWDDDLNLSSFAGFTQFNVDGVGSPYVVDYNTAARDLTLHAGNLLFIGASWADFVDTTARQWDSKKKKWLNPFDPDYDSFKLSKLTVSTVTVVPEPATWAMMIGGFGIVGAAMRLRRRTAVLVAS